MPEKKNYSNSTWISASTTVSEVLSEFSFCKSSSIGDFDKIEA